MQKIYVAIVALLSCGSTHAQLLEEQITACAAEPRALNRLDCFDRITTEHNQSKQHHPSTPIDGIGKWKISDERNPVDDTRTVSLLLYADAGQSKWGKESVLVIRCLSYGTDVYIDWGGYLGSDVTVTTRIGDQAAVTKKWNISTDKQTSFHPRSSINLVKSLTEHQRYVAQVTPYNDSPITAIFDLTGLPAAIKPLREACKW